MHFKTVYPLATASNLKRINELRLRITPSSRRSFTKKRLAALNNRGDCLIVAIADADFPIKHFRGRIVGMGMLMVCDNISSVFGVIHTMVTDRDAEGFGVGNEILRTLIALGREKKLDYIDLTSGEQRTRAISLYTRYGFENIEKNYFRLDFRESPNPR